MEQPALKYLCPLFQVFDMPASLKFYVDILGFKIVQSSGEGYDVDWIWIKKDGIDIMLNTAYEKPYRPEKPEALREQWHSDVSLYFGCTDITGMYEYLKPHLPEINPPIVTGYDFDALEIKDPDGYLLIFHWPRNSQH